MKPRRTPTSNQVFRLVGGNEDNDLWVEQAEDVGGSPIILSVWELSDAERAAIAAGATIELMVWGQGTPPVALGIGPSLSDRKAAAA